jgi:hypothetical protein
MIGNRFFSSNGQGFRQHQQPGISPNWVHQTDVWYIDLSMGIWSWLEPKFWTKTMTKTWEKPNGDQLWPKWHEGPVTKNLRVMQPLFHGLYMDHTIFPTIQHKYNMRYTIDIIPYYTILYHIVPYYTILYHIIMDYTIPLVIPSGYLT